MYQESCVEPYAYVDSDWAGDINTRKSIIGMDIMLAGASIAYKQNHNRQYHTAL